LTSAAPATPSGAAGFAVKTFPCVIAQQLREKPLARIRKSVQDSALIRRNPASDLSREPESPENEKARSGRASSETDRSGNHQFP
jgi:hypothetical protein